VNEYRHSPDPNKREAVKLFESSKQRVSEEMFSDMSLMRAMCNPFSVVTSASMLLHIVKPVCKMTRNMAGVAQQVAVASVHQTGKAVVSTVKSVTHPFTSAARMVSSAKQLSHVLGWLIVGQPIVAAAAMTTWSIKKASCPGPRYLQQVLDGGAANNGQASWENLYPHGNQVICEAYDQLRENGGVLSEDIQKYFFWYLRNRSTNSAENQIELSAESIDKLRYIIGSLIRQHPESLLQRPEACSEWEDILVVWEPHLRAEDNVLLKQVVEAATKRRHLAYAKKAEAFIGEIYRVVGNYLLKNLVSEQEVLVWLHMMKQLIVTHTPWNGWDPMRMFTEGLLFFKQQRLASTSAKVWAASDSYVRDSAAWARREISTKYPEYPVEDVSVDTGMLYVRYLAPQDQMAFNGTHKIVEPQTILPHDQVTNFTENDGSSGLNITIHYDRFSLQQVEEVVDRIKIAYRTTEALKKKFDLGDAEHDLGDAEQRRNFIKMYVWNNQYHFQHYGWRFFGVNSSGGGVTGGVCGADGWNTVHVYQTPGQKEDGVEVLNLGHETGHVLMCKWLGKNYRYLSGTLVEGFADYLNFSRQGDGVDPLKIGKLHEMFKSGNAGAAIKNLSEIMCFNTIRGYPAYFWGNLAAQYVFKIGNISESVTLLKGIQVAKNKKDIDTALKEYVQQEEKNFNTWLTKLNQDDQALLQDVDGPDDRYRWDVEQSPLFAHFIAGGKWLEIEFLDISFKLALNISCHMPPTLSPPGTHWPRSIGSGDYDWFIQTVLACFMENMLSELKLGNIDKAERSKVIQSMFGMNALNWPFDLNRQIKSIKLYDASGSLHMDFASDIPAEFQDLLLHSSTMRQALKALHNPRVPYMKMDIPMLQVVLQQEIEENRRIEENKAYEAAALIPTVASSTTSLTRLSSRTSRTSRTSSITTPVAQITTSMITTVRPDILPIPFPLTMRRLIVRSPSSTTTATQHERFSIPFSNMVPLSSTMAPRQNFTMTNGGNESTTSEAGSLSQTVIVAAAVGIPFVVVVSAALMFGGVYVCIKRTRWARPNVSTQEQELGTREVDASLLRPSRDSRQSVFRGFARSVESLSAEKIMKFRCAGINDCLNALHMCAQDLTDQDSLSTAKKQIQEMTTSLERMQAAVKMEMELANFDAVSCKNSLDRCAGTLTKLMEQSWHMSATSRENSELCTLMQDVAMLKIYLQCLLPEWDVLCNPDFLSKGSLLMVADEILEVQGTGPALSRSNLYSLQQGLLKLELSPLYFQDRVPDQLLFSLKALKNIFFDQNFNKLESVMQDQDAAQYYTSHLASAVCQLTVIEACFVNMRLQKPREQYYFVVRNMKQTCCQRRDWNSMQVERRKAYLEGLTMGTNLSTTSKISVSSSSSFVSVQAFFGSARDNLNDQEAQMPLCASVEDSSLRSSSLQASA